MHSSILLDYSNLKPTTSTLSKRTKAKEKIKGLASEIKDG